MRYTIRIKRQENKEAKPFWQEFEIEAEVSFPWQLC